MRDDMDDEQREEEKAARDEQLAPLLYGIDLCKTALSLLLTFASDKETPPVQKTPCLLHFWQSCPFLLTCKGQ